MTPPGTTSAGASHRISIWLFWRCFTLRHLRRDWFQTFLLLVILGLGVGTFLSIRMANRAAVDGFRLFTDSLRGTSDWIIESPNGSIPLVDLPAIRKAIDGLPVDVFPVLETSLYPLQSAGGDSGTTPSAIKLLGLDLVQLRNIASSGENSSPEAFWEMLDNPRHLLVSVAIAEALNIQEGSLIEATINGSPMTFEVTGILPRFRDKVPLPRNLAIADLRALLNRTGREAVDRVEVVIPPGAMRRELVPLTGERLASALHERYTLSTPADKRMDGETMTTAFRLNLTVLSLVALLVGIFLIAQTLDATVSRRRREIATLRSLGISQPEIYRLWLSEAVLYGLLAGLLGLLAGYALTTYTVEAVTTTVQSLYRETSLTAAKILPSDVILSFALGIGGSLLAAWLPAKDAASTPPAQFLRMGKRIPPFPVFEHPKIGAGMLIMGALLALLPPWESSPGVTVPAAGFATAFLWLTGGTLVAAALLKTVGYLFHLLGRNHASARLAGSRLAQPTSRHQLALAGFFVAIGMASAMAFLINSFEHTVTGWLQQRLRADIFVSSTGFQGADSGPRMNGALLDEIETIPEVRELDRFRSQEATVNGVRFSLAGSRFDLLGKGQELLWLDKPESVDLQPVIADAAGFANENFIRRTGLSKGDTFTIPTPAGDKTILVAGIHADYARDNGLFLINLPRFEDWYRVSDYETAAIFLQPDADISVFQEGLRKSYPGLTFRQNGELMEAALFIFHQTFAVTRALQVIGLTVALAGLVLSLLSLLMESGRELSLQRTLGMTRHEIALTTALEGGGIALAGLLSGLFLSLMLGLLLIFVINRQSFGWTLQATWPWKDSLLLAGSVFALGLGIAYGTGRLYMRKWKPDIL
ncbi:MAG: FtsX-like permease family protein [Puniceicoccaceae bacterium]